MATQIIKQRVCDLCGSAEGIKTYRVGVVGNGRGVAPDLCEEHAEPLETVMSAVPKGRTATGLRKQPKVKSEAEIKKLRRKA
jgi:hypothetical protein